MEKVLTIVVPTYNMEKYLERCLSSLLISDKEAFNTLEVLVVNDGSKDNSSTIAHSFQDKYPDVFTTIDKDNGNYGSCINVALKIAKGKYIKILDADDCFETNNISTFVSFLSKCSSDMVISDFTMINDEDNEIKQVKYPKCLYAKILSFGALESILFIWKSLPMHAITYRTSLLIDSGYKQTEGISYTDQEWAYIPLFSVKCIAFFNKTIYKYRLGRDGQTMDPVVFDKSRWMHEKCLLNKAGCYFSSRPASVGASLYLKRILYINLREMYTHYIYNSKDKIKTNLIPLDDAIFAIDNQKLANSIKLKRTFFHMVRYWRKHGRVQLDDIVGRLAHIQHTALSKQYIYSLFKTK